jgi:hypothetical protein
MKIFTQNLSKLLTAKRLLVSAMLLIEFAGCVP